MEVRHHVIGVLNLDIDGRHGDRIKPVKPPIVNTKMKPTAQSIGVSKVIEPRHMVASQLKIFTPVGTAISMVAYMKNSWPVTGMPVANIW